MAKKDHKVEKRPLTREDTAAEDTDPGVTLADVQGPNICGVCDGEGVVYETGDGTAGDTWTCDACEGSGDVA